MLFACERSDVMRGEEEEEEEAEEIVVSVGLEGLLTQMLIISLEVRGGDVGGGEEVFRRFR